MATLPMSSPSDAAAGDWELIGSSAVCASAAAADEAPSAAVDAGAQSESSTAGMEASQFEETSQQSAAVDEAFSPPPRVQVEASQFEETSQQSAAADEAPSPPPRVQECIMVCIDRSGSMGTPFNEEVVNIVAKAKMQRTRMEAVKVMFYAFRDRAESLGSEGGGFEMGLIQFDSSVDRLLELTPQLERFEEHVDDMEKRGATAIYSAIAEAATILEERFKEDQRIDLRVLVLTDGQNNSGLSPTVALQAVNRIGAVVDAIIVGDRADENLRKIVSATGGECFQINDLGDGFELLEAESVVSLKSRRGGVEKPPFVERPLIDMNGLEQKSFATAAAVASRRSPNVTAADAPKSFIDAAAFFSGAAPATKTASDPSSKRVLKELGEVGSGKYDVWLNSGEGIHVFAAPENIKFWRALIEGPAESPFKGGVFALNIAFPETYPFAPPKISFETPVYHCNVSDTGALCLDILKDSWSPALTVPKCLEAIRVMLKDPNPNDALRQWIAELTIAHQKTDGEDTRYVEKAREATQQHASRSVEEWRKTWGSC